MYSPQQAQYMVSGPPPYMFGMSKSSVMLLGVLIVFVAFAIWYMYSDSATPPEPNPSGGIPLPGGTGAPSAGTGTNIVVVDTPSSGTGGITGTSGGANVFVSPVDNTNINTDSAAATPSTTTPSATTPIAATPISGLKMISLYKEPNFGGVPKPLAPGGSAKLAVHENGKYVFVWKSMKVEPGTKIMFSRYIGGGNTRHSFAVGQFNVTDLEDWLRTYDRISGTGNWGYGSLTIDRFDTYQTEPIHIAVLNDADWIAAINAENAACNGLMTEWNKYTPGRYSSADCASVNPSTFSEVYTY